jgi:hypothetical protein
LAILSREEESVDGESVVNWRKHRWTVRGELEEASTAA